MRQRISTLFILVGIFVAISSGQFTCCFYEINGNSTTYENFNSPNDLQFTGDSTTQNGNIILSPAQYWQDGAVWSVNQYPYGIGFATSFSFSFSNFDSQFQGADGMAFVIQSSSPTALGEAGGGIGYDGLSASVAIEFDTYMNSAYGDLDDNHISVHTRGVLPNSCYEQYSLGQLWNVTPALKSSDILTATITYTSESINENGLLQVFYEDMKPLSIELNLASLLKLDNGMVWLGFTSATGGGVETATLYNWSFRDFTPATACIQYFDCPAFPNSSFTGSQQVHHCDDCFY